MQSQKILSSYNISNCFLNDRERSKQVRKQGILQNKDYLTVPFIRLPRHYNFERNSRVPMNMICHNLRYSKRDHVIPILNQLSAIPTRELMWAIQRINKNNSHLELDFSEN
jgi:hypothetical protein